MRARRRSPLLNHHTNTLFPHYFSLTVDSDSRTSFIKSTATTRTPTFSGAITFSTVERLVVTSGLPGMLALDKLLSDSFLTPDPSVAQILYIPNSPSATEFSRIATAGATPRRGNGSGSPFTASGTNSAPSPAFNAQRGA